MQLTHIICINRRATVQEIAEKYISASPQSIIIRSTRRIWKQIFLIYLIYDRQGWWHSFHCKSKNRGFLEETKEHWALGKRKKYVWSDESIFLFHVLDGANHVGRNQHNHECSSNCRRNNDLESIFLVCIFFSSKIRNIRFTWCFSLPTECCWSYASVYIHFFLMVCYFNQYNVSCHRAKIISGSFEEHHS